MHIIQSTASDYYQKHRVEQQLQIPENNKEKKKTGHKPKLNEEHTKHLVKSIGERPTAVVENTKSDRFKKFNGLTISTSPPHKTFSQGLLYNIEKDRNIASCKSF